MLSTIIGLFVLYTVLFVLWITVSDYDFGIFKMILLLLCNIFYLFSICSTYFIIYHIIASYSL